jgi:predicted membrane protein
MSETEILITYVSVAFLLLAIVFVYVAFARANHEYEGEESIVVFVIGAIFWPFTLPIAMLALCATLIIFLIVLANDSLAKYIRRKSK